MKDQERKSEKEQARAEAKKLRRQKKRNARVLCRDGKEFWTTQAQFWQWVRQSAVVKTGDGPLTGHFLTEHFEYDVVVANSVLNLKCPNHLSEVVHVRRRVLG